MKVGREHNVVLYAMRKWASSECDGILSVFCLDNSPGRVYIETMAILKAYELLQHASFVSWNNIHVVPINERPQLLSPVRSRMAVGVGGFVNVRSGLYRGDMGQVVEIDENGEFFHVRVVPRITPPVPSRRLEKRARRNIVRPVPQRLRKSEAIWVFGETAVKDSGDGFKFKGHFYDKNGFRIIGLRHYSVVETTPSLQHISIFLDAAIEEIEVDHLDPKKPDSTSKPIKPIKDYSDDDIFQIANIDPLQLAAESYLNIGNVVEVFEGAQRGMLGRVVSVATNGTIQICETKHSETRSPPLLVDLSLREVRLFLSVGESVSVKYGVFAGRVGVVEVVNGAHLVVRERGSFDEVSEAQHLCSKAC